MNWCKSYTIRVKQTKTDQMVRQLTSSFSASSKPRHSPRVPWKIFSIGFQKLPLNTPRYSITELLITAVESYNILYVQNRHSKIPCQKNGRVKVPWHIEHPQSTFSLKSFFSTAHKSCHSRSDMFSITKIHHILMNMEKQARVSRPKLGSKCNATDIQYSQLVLSGGMSNHSVQWRI